MKGHRRAPGSSLMVGSGQPQLPSLVKMTATSSAVGSKRRLSDMSGTSSTKGKKGRKPATVTSANQPQRARPVSQRKVGTLSGFYTDPRIIIIFPRNLRKHSDLTFWSLQNLACLICKTRSILCVTIVISLPKKIYYTARIVNIKVSLLSIIS